MGNVDRILRAKVQLQKKNPFYAHILLGIVHKPDDNIPTACINIFGKMRYNPVWIDSLTDEQVEGVMKHEALHLILEHLKRRISYLKRYRMLTEKVWAISEDMVVNDILIQSGEDLPEGIVPEKTGYGRDKGKSTHRYEMKELGITIEEIDKKSVEMIYTEIMKQIPKVDGSGDGEGEGEGEGDGSGIITAVPDDDSEGEGDGEADGDGEGESGNGKQKDKNGKGKDKKNKQDKKEQELIDKLPKGFDEHERPDDDNKVTEKQQEEQLKKWRKKFVEAVEISKNRGNLPAGMERLCEELYKEKLNWKSILYRFISKAIPFDYYWSKPSRKSHVLSQEFGVEMALPNIDKEKIEIIISIDTSGSISDKELAEFSSEMIGIAKSFHNVDILAIVCDCDLQTEPIELKNATVDDIKRLAGSYKGGGGTSHKPVFKWVDENKPNAKLIICFTDGYTDFPKAERVSIKTIWALSGNHCDKNNIPFGDIVEIPRYEE